MSAGWASALRLLAAAERLGPSLPLGVALRLLLLLLIVCNECSHSDIQHCKMLYEST